MALDGYDLLGFVAAAGSDSPAVHASIRRVLRGFGPVDVGLGLHLPRFEVVDGGDVWRLRIDGDITQEDADSQTAIGALEWNLMTAALGNRDDLFQLHAASLCVPTQRAGLVITGDSRCGKTTLALALMLRGFALFGDDVALIEPETLELRPFRRAAHVSDDTRRLLAGVNGEALPWDTEDPSGYFSPPQWAVEAAPVRWVLLPEYEPGRRPELVPLSPAEAAAAIASGSPSLARAPQVALSTVARLVDRASVYRFLTGDLAATVAVVQQLVAQPLREPTGH